MIARAWGLALPLAALLSSGAPARARAEAMPPRPTEISYYYDNLENNLVRPIARQLDPVHVGRKLTGRPREAANVDAQDQVRLPSTWWQPRAGFRAVTVEQMLTGPGPGTGPAPGPWTVTSAKTQGVTPGFFIRDANGDRFIVKFDPPDHAEMATAADAITCVLMWACGYNVPDNAIASFQPGQLRIAEGATWVNERGRKVPMTRAFLDGLIAKLPSKADGSIRCATSRLLAGTPLGPFEYRGRRRDDPEDLVPHQMRRELRGLWPIAAWVNHADVSARNTLDIWVTESGRSFVRHHLIDFGACLGSASIGAQSPVTGSEYFVDYGVIGTSLATLGLRPFAWEPSVDPRDPKVGYVEAEVFDPSAWRPYYPNPAFDDRTERDVRWGARILSGVTDDHIRAAVARGRLSDPKSSEYLVRVLIQRRDKLVARWLDASVAAR